MSELFPEPEPEAPQGEQEVEIRVPLLLPGFNVPENQFRSRLVFPPGTTEVSDEHFRMFAEEMREQYEVLESDLNVALRECKVLKSELIRQKNATTVLGESYKQLVKKLLKVLSRDYPQFKFGETILDNRFNIVLPVYNENTNRFTNYSNLTRSFLDIIKS